MGHKDIKLLEVDDDPIIRRYLARVLGRQPGITITGMASNGLEAIELVEKLRPDVVTMDLSMPQMGGLEATERIMETNPLPIIAVSGGIDPDDVSTTFQAIERGAVAALPRPAGNADNLASVIRLMSEVKVIRRWKIKTDGGRPQTADFSVTAPTLNIPANKISIIGIGASAGGPPVVRQILSGLPKNISVPVLVVQHVAPEFADGFMEWLGKHLDFPVRTAVDGESAMPGTAYLAPADHHLGVRKEGILKVRKDPPENNLRPAVSYLFRSIAETYGNRAMGVLLTGMGKDGAEELKLMADRGSLTIAQNEESCVVFGMPGEAVRLGAARYVLPPKKIADLLVSATRITSDSKIGRQ